MDKAQWAHPTEKQNIIYSVYSKFLALKFPQALGQTHQEQVIERRAWHGVEYLLGG